MASAGGNEGGRWPQTAVADSEFVFGAGISLFFPAYNDALSLPSLLDRTFETLRRVAVDYEVIVVNDGSTDNTAEILDELTQKYAPHLRVVTHGTNRGYGAALRSGFIAATKEYVFYTDGDGQYDPAELEKLLRAATPETGLVNGYKIQRSDPWHRTAIGWLYNTFARWLFRIRLRDIDCDFRLIRRSALDVESLRSTGGTICIELVRAIELSGSRIVEIPVHHYPRRYGRSQFFRVRSLLWTFLQLCEVFLRLVLAPTVLGTGKRKPATIILLDLLLICVFAAVLVRPLFKARYTDKWASIESTFIGDARFLADHWPHPQWQPLWYGGTRFDYIYPPALRYGTAAISKVTGTWPVKAYHVYTAFFYCIGIAGVYLLVRVGTRSRGMAWLCASATALMSPSFLFLVEMRRDAWMWEPLRLGVMVKYGEGPHMTALALIPIALAFTWLAFQGWRPAALALAALFSALVVSNNFYGAAALAIFYPILVWSFWITRQDKRILLPALAIPALTYGLTASWLVPSYFKVTAENMKYVSEHGTTWSIWIALAVAVVFALASDRLARGKPERTWAVFAAGCAVFFSLNVLGNYYFNFRVSGEPSRMAPELDLVFILLAATTLRWLWNKRGAAPRTVAAIVVVAAFATTIGYLRHAWHMFPLWPNYQERIEYRISDWLWKNMPNARTAATGSVRFWFDTWHDLPQLGGGSDQGLLNGVVEAAQWELNLGSKPEPAILWMQCLGVDTVYISDKNSEEKYKDAAYPQKFSGVLPVLYDDHQGNWLYQIPWRYAARARVVETQKLSALRRPRFNDDVSYLKSYAGIIENGPESPATLTRQGTDALRVRARLAAGQSILVQESYDPAWHAWSGGRALPIHQDAMGFMVIDAPPGDRDVTLAFVTPLENQIGRAVSAISILAIFVLIALGIRRERWA